MRTESEITEALDVLKSYRKRHEKYKDDFYDRFYDGARFGLLFALGKLKLDLDRPISPFAVDKEGFYKSFDENQKGEPA